MPGIGGAPDNVVLVVPPVRRGLGGDGIGAIARVVVGMCGFGLVYVFLLRVQT